MRETWDDLLGTQFESVRQISHHLTQYLTSLLAQSRCGVFIIAGEYPPVCYSSYLVLKLPLRSRLPSDCESSPLSALPLLAFGLLPIALPTVVPGPEFG